MQSRCWICGETMRDRVVGQPPVCLICAHRTTRAERRQRRLVAAGVMDSA